MSILITGATGFIGQNLTKYLIKNKWPVIPTCRDLQKAKELKIKKAVQMNLDDPDMIRKVMQKYQPDVVIHLGAISSPNSTISSLEYLSTNILSTQVICEELKNKRMIFASSVVVYGNNLNQDELCPLSPTTLYGATKAGCENLLQYHKEVTNINYCSLRLCAVVGPGMTHGAIKDIREKVRKTHCVLYGGFPGSSKPYIHVNDVCRFIEYSIPKKDRLSVYNVCPDDSISISEIKKIFDPMGTCIAEWDKTKVWPGDNRIIKCNNDRLTAIFDLQYPTSKSAIESLLEKK